jgi:hypothetical protein
MPGVNEEVDGVSLVAETWGESTFGAGRKTSRTTGRKTQAGGLASLAIGQSGLASGFGDFNLGDSDDDSFASDATNWATTFGAASQSSESSGLAGGAFALAGQALETSPALAAAAQAPAPASVTVAAGATVDIAGPGTDSVTFLGSTGALVVEDSLKFEGQISGLSGADTIDLADLSFNSSTEATFLGTATGGTLTITNGAQTEEIALTGDYLSSTWTVSSDGAGGTDVVDPVVSTNWQVLKVGAGGYVDGLDIDPDGTMVVRTNTNGAYLWNGTSWQQLVTSSSMPAAFVAANPVSSGQGVYEIQMAPSNSNIMYMMFDGYVFSSTNKGTTWTQTSFAQVAANPNGSFDNDGQRMAVDPSNPNIVYVGTAQNGLWLTTNGGQTWTQVSSIPVGNADNGGYPGITGIVFDSAIGGVVNGVTQTIFAASYGNGVYESTNGGSTWKQLSGGPADVEYAVVSSSGAYYATDGTNLWRYVGGVWTELLSGSYGGIESIAVNPNNPNEIVTVSSADYLNVSYDGGKTWSGVNEGNNISSTDIPWLADANVGTGSNAGYAYLTIGGVAFSQTTPNELIATGGTGVWDVTIPSSGLTSTTNLTWSDMSTGIENLVANEILVAPGGDPILASWDRPFFYISDLNAYPSTYGPVNSDNMVEGWSVDYASSTPSFIVGIADWYGTEESGYSTNGGQTWTDFPTELSTNGTNYVGGTIAASTPQNIIWAPSGGVDPYYTLNGGETWNAITLPGVTSWANFDWAYYLTTRSVTADRVLANTFYLYYNGVYETTNGGQSWTEVYSGALSPGALNSEIMSVPGEAGNLFFTAGIQGDGANPPSTAGFYMSTNQGETWTALPNVLEVTTFGFGAAAPGSSYPTIFIVGYVNDVYGVWQSTNKGQSWTQIGTQPVGELDRITTISGDMDNYGQVYVGFAGGGYAYLSETAPTVTSVTAAPSSGLEIPGDSITFTVDMSEAVTVSGGTPTLTLNDGGVATYTAGSGSDVLTFTYTVAASNTDVSALAITAANLNGATITDASGNEANLSGVATTFSNIAIDPPSITGLTDSPASGDLGVGKTVTLTLQLSDVVTVSGGTPTLTLNDGGVATYSGGSGTNALTFTYTVGASNTDVASLAATSVNLNGATIANAAGASADVTLSGVSQSGPQIDTTTPTLTGLVDSPASGDLGVGSTVTLTLDLNEAVTVSGGTPTLTLNDGGVATYSGGSGTNALTFTYTVAASNTAVASLAATSVNLNGATIANGAGTAATLSLSGVSQSGPQIGAATLTGIVDSPASGDLGVGKTVTLTLDLNEAATVPSGTLTLTLNDGGVATYSSGSGTDALTFTYTVGASDTSVASLLATAVDLNGVTVESLSGVSQSGPQIDTSTPTLTGLVDSPASGDLAVGKTVTLTLKLSEAVTVSGGTPTLTLNDGGVATYSSGSGTNALTFTYTVAASNTDVASLAASSVNLNGATIANGAGTAASLSLSGVSQSGPQIDTTTPTLTGLVDSPASGDLGVGKTVTLTLKFSDVVTVSGGTPTLTLNDGGVATYSSGSGTNALTFTYTVAASNTDVASLAATSVNLNGATIANGAGTAATLSLSGVSQSGPQIDTTTPTLTGVVDSPASGELGVGKTVTLTLDLSEAVTVSGGTPTLTLNDGGVATYSGGSGTNALTFTYTVAASNTDVASLAASSVNLNGATIANGAGTAASLSLSGVSQSGPQIVNGVVLSGGRVSASNENIYLSANATEFIAGSADTVYANSGGDTITIGGNGRTGNPDLVYGQSDKLTVEASSHVEVFGSNDAITVGSSSNLSVAGSADTVILSSGDDLWFSGATSSEIVIGKGVGATIESFLPSANDVIDLINGAGGYTSAAAVVSALTSDGAGGSELKFGATSIHFIGVAPSALTAQNFKIG